MHSRKQLANVIAEILTSEIEIDCDCINQSTVDEYRKLNDKCDAVIEKIRERKSKKSNQIGE
jgi:hypothetical protein